MSAKSKAKKVMSVNQKIKVLEQRIEELEKEIEELKRTRDRWVPPYPKKEIPWRNDDIEPWRVPEPEYPQPKPIWCNHS